MGRKLDKPFDELVERVKAELQVEGFGVLSEIDVQATLREKLGQERESYLILGACNRNSRTAGSRSSRILACCCPATW